MGGQLFDDLFLEDVDGPKLNQLPQMIEAYELYKSKFCKICEELVTFGLKEAQNRARERGLFQSAVNKAKEADKVQGVAGINEFLAYKKKVRVTFQECVSQMFWFLAEVEQEFFKILNAFEVVKLSRGM